MLGPRYQKSPAVSGQKRQGNKKQGKLVQVFLEFCGFGFKCIPPQRHLHPFRVECWGSSERIWSWKLHQPWRNPLTFHPKTSNKDCITTTPTSCEPKHQPTIPIPHSSSSLPPAPIFPVGTSAKCWLLSSSSCTARVQTELSDQRRVFQTLEIQHIDQKPWAKRDFLMVIYIYIYIYRFKVVQHLAEYLSFMFRF